MRIITGLFLMVLSFAYCTNGQSSAYQFVVDLYSHYQNDTSSFSSMNPKSIDTIYSPEFLKTLRAYEKKESSGLGYDPVCDCQDEDGFKMKKINIFKRDNITYAEIKFDILLSEYTVTLKLIRKNGKWLIADITTTRGSLLSFLTTGLLSNK
jgi:hypothetical protein